MPGGWSKLRDIAKLADARAQFEFAIPVAELPGIAPEWAVADEPVRVGLKFAREQGTAVVEVELTARLRPLCQRCLQPMLLRVGTQSRVAVIETAAAADRVPGEMETFLAPEGRCDMAALAAEELLLALPIVPRHGEGERCEAPLDPVGTVHEAGGAPGDGGATAVGATGAGLAPAVAADTQRPFADLRALLERGKS